MTVIFNDLGVDERGSHHGCTTCRKKGMANFDVPVDVAKLNGPITVKVVVYKGEKALNFPLSSCGSPTVNARVPLT